MLALTIRRTGRGLRQLGKSKYGNTVMKKLIIAVATVMAFMTTAAFAEGFSIGASIGSAKIAVDDSSAGIDFDATDLGWKIFGKYMFNDNWGLELGYVDLGAPDDTILTVPVEISADGIDLYLIGSIPLSDSFDLFGKVGAIAWDAEISTPTPGVPSESDDGTDLALGVGVSLHASDTFSILGEFEWFDIADADQVWMVSLGIEIGF